MRTTCSFFTKNQYELVVLSVHKFIWYTGVPAALCVCVCVCVCVCEHVQLLSCQKRLW